MPFEPLSAACKAYWAEFVRTLPAHDARRTAQPDAFGFGGEAALADELGALVLAGKKRATTSLPVEFTSMNEPLPKPGDLSIILDGRGGPVAIIERISVELVPFQAVSEEYAACEGEGDGSLRYWRDAHTWYFNKVCSRLGGCLAEDTPVLCQRFRLVWPAPSDR